MSPAPAVPRYGKETLPDLATSLLAALGVPGEGNPLGLPSLPRACLLLVDGLGWQSLRSRAADAPFLAALADSATPLDAGFPATTATSLASLGTGRPPGRHGIVGYQMAVPGTEKLLNCLRWDAAVDPVAWQPTSTVYERARAAGISAAYVSRARFAESGLTRATARGARYFPADSMGELVDGARVALRGAERALVHVYHGDLDATGHRRGVGSPAWGYQLAQVDRLAEQLAGVLPAGSALYVIADHGMLDPADRVDVDAIPELNDGVTLLGGEPRARHVYTRPQTRQDVLAAWRETLGERAWVLAREEAVAAGWFGPVTPDIEPRIGDVVVAARGATALIASAREPRESRLVGMHGSFSADEQLVPLLRVVA